MSSTMVPAASTPPIPALNLPTSPTSPAADYPIFADALAQFSSTQHSLTAQLITAQKRLEQDFKTLDDIYAATRQQWTEYERLVSMHRDLSAQSAHLTQSMRSTLTDDALTLTVCKRKLDALKQAKGGTKQHNSWYLRLMLGQINVQMYRRADQIGLKEEYNKFKSRTTIIFLLFPIIQLILITPNHWVFQAHQIWLMYYYVTLSLRENILWANGSSLKRWWIYHHYVSITITACMLLFPTQYMMYRLPLFYQFGLVQGLVMIAQNWYQAKRGYVRKSLGKAATIDVDSTETIVEKPTDLKWLVPLLIALYIAELGFGIDFIRVFINGDNATDTAPYSIPILWIGLGFCLLALGNALTTTQVIMSKSALRRLSRLLAGRKSSGATKELTESEIDAAVPVVAAAAMAQATKDQNAADHVDGGDGAANGAETAHHNTTATTQRRTTRRTQKESH